MNTQGNYIIATLHGIGDLCLVGGLMPAFRARYGGGITLVVKESHLDIAKMFANGPIDRLEVMVDNQAREVIALQQQNGNIQLLPQRGRPFLAHPEHVRVRPDYCVAVGRMTDVAMYALILGLDPHTPLQPPIVPAEAYEMLTIEASGVPVTGHTAVIFPAATSWPVPVGEAFWEALARLLRARRWDVVMNDPRTPLRYVVPIVERAGWVIGANSGIMQFIVQARAKCRKTIITTSIEGVSYPLPVRSALPYRSMRTVLGDQYDIEEYCLDSGNIDAVLLHIAEGRNMHGDMPSPDPQPIYDVPLPPGEVFDRIGILQLKALRLPDKAHNVYRELVALLDVRKRILADLEPSIADANLNVLLALEGRLHALNAQAWDDNQTLFDNMAGDYGLSTWCLRSDIFHEVAKAEMCLRAFRSAGIDANQERIRVKNEINRLCGFFDREQKSYET